MKSVHLKRLKQLGITTALICVFFTANLLNAESSQEQQKLENIVKELQQAHSTLKKQQSKKSQNEQKLRDSEILLGKTRKEIRQASRKLNGIEKEISALENEKNQLESSIAKQKSALRKDMINSYSTGRQEYFKVLLNQEDPATTARLITYYNYFHKARNTRIDAFQNSLMALDSLNLELKDRYNTTSEIKKGLIAQQQKISKEQNKRSLIIKNLSKEISTQEKSISRLASAREELEKIIQRVGDIMADINNKLGSDSFKARKGKFAMPAKGRIVSKYRSQRAGGKLRSNGIIIGAKQGTEVSSVHHGRVVFSDWLRGFGLLIIIDHGDGYMTLYGHNETLLKETGDWVSSGDTVATTGNTGGQEKSGLYFEIRKNGRPTNPLAWCKTR